MGRSGWRSFIRVQVAQALCGLLLLQSAPAFADLVASSQERQSWVRLTAAERSPAVAMETREQEAPALAAAPAEARPMVLAQAQPSPQPPAFPRDGNGPAEGQEEHGLDTDGHGLGTDEEASSPATVPEKAAPPAPGELPPSPPGVKSLQSGVNLVTVAAKAGSTSELVLQAGWNLVSLARQPGNPAPASFFSGAASRVFAYDACDAADPWKVWDPANPAGSDLAAISPKLGLWAEAPAAVTLPVAGTEPATTTIHLCPGWNLIGAPFSQDRSVTGALSSIQGKYARVFGYDAADPADPWEVYDVAAPAWANTLQVFEPGKGYWIFATVETDLVLSNDITGPVVQISAPADLSEVTTLTNVVGTVSSELIEEWRLAYRALGDAQWTTIASGTTPVINGVLGVFDPTLLLNGPYQLELTATDANNLEQSFRVDIAVEGQQKIGNFTLTFQDLEVPLSGLPIQILRTYDSRDKRKGDFGVGWTLDIRQGSYRNNRQPGEGWQFASGFLPCQFIRESLGHVTTIRLSDRELYRFKLSLGSGAPTLGGCFAQARFDFVDGPMPGATLAILGNTQVLYQNGDNRVVDASSLEIYEPQAVRLTTRDGRIFDLNLQQGVTRLQDRNGNELSIHAGGITHTSGRTVNFERDGQGRITRITDPEGASLLYEYDAAGDLVKVTDRAEQETRFTYNAAHGLLDIEDARGIKPVRNEYDGTGRLLRSIDAFGKAIEYNHDLGNRQEIITDRLGHNRLLEYDARGNVVREIDANGKETRRTVDSRDNLLSERDPLGNTSLYSYDAEENLVSFTDPLGQQIRYTYDNHGQVLTVTDARGKVTTNVYDFQGNLTSFTDQLGNATTYTYDVRGNLVTETDAEGNTRRYEYDLQGILIKETDAVGHDKVYTYDSNGNRLTRTEIRTTAEGPETLTWTYEYDDLNRLVRTTEPDGKSFSSSYDAIGNLQEEVDRLGRKTTYSYDAAGRRTGIVYPDGTSEAISYDAGGRRATFTDRGGRTTRYEYDPVGRMARIVYPDNSSTANTYDDAGRLTSATDERGNATTYIYDAAGRRTKAVDALENETVSGYDANGSQTSAVDAKGRTTKYEYDDAGRWTKITYPDGTFQTTTYDRAGRTASETDQAGRTTRFTYDGAGRILTVTDAASGEIRYSYDELGNRTSETNANGRVTRIDYDALGRPVKRTLPTNESETMSYDDAGNLTSHKNFGGATVLYAYDLANRLTSRTYPDGSAVSFSYTPAGLRATATDSRGTAAYQYDGRDRLTRVSNPNGQSLGYTYDPHGNRASLTATIGGTALTIVYSYDVANRLARVTDPQNRAYEYGYSETGRKTTLTHPNGIETAYSYDSLDRLIRLESKTSGGSVFQSFAYTVGPAGHRTRVQEASGTVRSYEYDNVHRLTLDSVARSATDVVANRFSYDLAGNRLTSSRTESAGTTSVAYRYDERDRLLTQGATTYTWDANGNLLTKSGGDGATYVWSFDHQLIGVTQGDGTIITHAYDADGNRVRTEITPANGPPTAVEYLIDPSHKLSADQREEPLSQVVAETRLTGELEAFYVRGGDELLAVVRPAGTRFYHADGLGSIRALTDEQGQVTDSYEYSAFGELLAHNGSDPNPFLFAGEAFQEDSGLYHLRARWLDPAAGRFTSTDPAAFVPENPRTFHRYVYADGDPVNFVDPSGRAQFSIGGLSVTLNIQGNLRSTTGSISVRALLRSQARLLQLGVRAVRQIPKRAGREVHHLIEQRLWLQNPALRRIFQHVDDIPGVSLTRAQHQVFTNAWRQAFPYSNSARHIANPTLEEIIQVAAQIYAKHPALLRAIYMALL